MEKLQKKLTPHLPTIDEILTDKDLMILAVLLILLLCEGSDLPLVLAVAYILLF
ncbi:MAG: hypothetical protein FWE60_02455 [Oscillospiraceae bacterium]|jgi:hypothetical protein|nr:hypothetical protein [Oscillospiraceae bacterium]